MLKTIILTVMLVGTVLSTSCYPSNGKDLSFLSVPILLGSSPEEVVDEIGEPSVKESCSIDGYEGVQYEYQYSSEGNIRSIGKFFKVCFIRDVAVAKLRITIRRVGSELTKDISETVEYRYLPGDQISGDELNI
jgi:hypothetical protein